MNRDDALPAAAQASQGEVGRARPHESAHMHVQGAAPYVDDLPKLTVTLHAAMGLSPLAHGGLRHEILYHDVPCRPCKRRDCATPQCVLGIPVADVLAAILRQLAARGTR